MTLYITDLDRITEALDPTGAIETFLWDDLSSCQWESVSQIISQLESASCAAGSWSGMIYTRDILDRLADSQWCYDIDEALDNYRDATGESPDLSSLSDMVTFAVDWVACELASKLRHLDQVAVVIAPVDACDPKPDVIAFASVWEAEDWVSEEAERRVQYTVEHSPHSISEDDLEAIRENELSLFTLTDERL